MTLPSPAASAPFLVTCYKNFAAQAGISHIGLGVAAANTAKVLRKQGIKVVVQPIAAPADIRTIPAKFPGITHLVISAPWIPTQIVAQFCADNPEIQLAINCHSNVGFLQADTNAVSLIRDYMAIERSAHNFTLAGNSRRFCNWIEECFAVTCQFLPNLYYLDRLSGSPRPPYRSGTIRIGMFGAVRPLKNMMTGAAAALEIARNLREPLELWMCSGRSEGGGQTVMTAIQAMYRNLPGVSLHEAPWQPWPLFRQLVASMHILLQPSYSESFNQVTSDGVAEGVASVVCEAITWAPPHWKADADDALDVARVGRTLLFDHKAPADGKAALQQYVAQGIVSWEGWLGV
jgi:hypothetical protein